MRAENFIYFSTVSGFFISIIFGILKDFDAFNSFWAVIIITSVFYILSLASSAFFIKFTSFSKLILSSLKLYTTSKNIFGLSSLVY
jgi:hypothetical protein